MLLIERTKVIETNIIIEHLEDKTFESIQPIILGDVRALMLKVYIKCLVEINGKKMVINSVTVKNVLSIDITKVRMSIDMVIQDMSDILKALGINADNIKGKLEVKESCIAMQLFKKKLEASLLNQ